MQNQLVSSDKRGKHHTEGVYSWDGKRRTHSLPRVPADEMVKTKVNCTLRLTCQLANATQRSAASKTHEPRDRSAKYKASRTSL